MDQVKPDIPKTPPECATTGSVSLELRPDSEIDDYERPESETDGYERPESETDGYERPESETDGYERPKSETDGYERPESETDGYERPESETDGYERPESETDGHERPESETDGHERPESETDGYERPESETDGFVLPESETDGYIRPESETDGRVPPELISTYFRTEDKKETCNNTESFDNKSKDFLQRQNTKRDILLRLNRKMSREVSATDVEMNLTVDGSSQAPIETVEIQSLKIPNQCTEETVDCSLTEADMTGKRPSHQGDGSQNEGPKEPTDDNIITYAKKESKRSRIPITAKPTTPEKLVKKDNAKKSKLPTTVIQVKPKTSEKIIKKTDLKKSKIPTRVIQVRSKAAENSSKKTDTKKSKIPSRVFQAVSKAVENKSKKSDLRNSTIPVNRGSPLAEMILNDIDLGKFKIPIKIPNPERLMDTSRLPVVVKDSESSVTVATFVEVKVSRLPQKLRSFFHKLKRPNDKKSDKKGAKAQKGAKAKKVRFSLPIDDIYRKALSGKGGIKSRLPMPIRVTHPGKLYPPPSQIPLAFSRFPNPAKVRKITLLRRVKKALTKQMAKINWKPKLNFPNLELFFQSIRGNNKVFPINA